MTCLPNQKGNWLWLLYIRQQISSSLNILKIDIKSLSDVLLSISKYISEKIIRDVLMLQNSFEILKTKTSQSLDSHDYRIDYSIQYTWSLSPVSMQIKLAWSSFLISSLSWPQPVNPSLCRSHHKSIRSVILQTDYLSQWPLTN